MQTHPKISVIDLARYLSEVSLEPDPRFDRPLSEEKMQEVEAIMERYGFCAETLRNRPFELNFSHALIFFGGTFAESTTDEDIEKASED